MSYWFRVLFCSVTQYLIKYVNYLHAFSFQTYVQNATFCHYILASKGRIIYFSIRKVHWLFFSFCNYEYKFLITLNGLHSRWYLLMYTKVEIKYRILSYSAGLIIVPKQIFISLLNKGYATVYVYIKDSINLTSKPHVKSTWHFGIIFFEILLFRI